VAQKVGQWQLHANQSIRRRRSVFLLKTLSLLSVSVAVLVMGSVAEAGKIWKIKGKTVFIDVDPRDDVRLHDQFEVVDPATHKKTGLLGIVIVDKGQVVAEVLKGKAVIDGTIEFFRAGSKSSLKNKKKRPGSGETEAAETDDLLEEVLGSRGLRNAPPDGDAVAAETFGRPKTGSADETDPVPSFRRPSKLPAYWGFGFGISPTTIVIKRGTLTNKMTASNFVARLCFDKQLDGNFSFLMGASYLPISGTQPDSSVGTAKFDSAFGSLDLSGRLSLFSPIHGPWLSAGINMMSSLTKPTSNLLDVSHIDKIVAFQLGVGYNKQMTPDYFTFRWDLIFHPQAVIDGTTLDFTHYIFSAIYFY
jgi:hypothetical protein